MHSPGQRLPPSPTAGQLPKLSVCHPRSESSSPLHHGVGVLSEVRRAAQRAALGVDVSALVAGLGLTGFALGFALKDVISNVLAGVLILIYKPFGKKNYISVKGYQGTVLSTDLRYTVLQADDSTKLFVPNSLLFVDAISVAKEKPSDRSEST